MSLTDTHPQSGPQPSLAAVQQLCAELEQLIGTLEAEFAALKSQRLAEFESLQICKEACIRALQSGFATLPADSTATDDQAPAAAPGMTRLRELARHCRDLQMRNGILVERKLGVVRAAMHALHQLGQHALETYDKSGKLHTELPRLPLAGV